MAYQDIRVESLYRISMNENKDPDGRIEAVKGLGNLSAMGNHEAREALGDIANSAGNNDVRIEAAHQLARGK